MVGRAKRGDIQDRRLVVRDGQRGYGLNRWDQRAEMLTAIARRPQPTRSRSPSVARDIEAVVVILDEEGLRVIRGRKQISAAERREVDSVVSGHEKTGISACNQRPHISGWWEWSRRQSRDHGPADGRRCGIPGCACVRAVV